MEMCLVFLLLVAAAAAAPSSEHGVPVTPAERERARLALQNNGLYQGDIKGYDPTDRNAVADERLRWKGARVPYYIDSSLTKHTKLIEAAMDNYHKLTCVKFVKRNGDEKALKIFSGQGCWATLGYQSYWQQEMSLGPDCLYIGTIIHELGHTLGFNHEQTRSDRDKYVKIYWDNIEHGMDSEFIKAKPEEEILYNNFDYGSIMIYGNYAFSKDWGKLKTMEATNSQPLLDPYDKTTMTSSDAVRVNKMYNCNM
ncbi:astacin-like metalloprotease toxin 5 [Uloborus diversus]|uniref:astacin-like metalloprotease toxin 5 n=1 Tax=Uloborus diversus TaxID=327109 RepID=UPI00240A31CA|nr:astacin-like metalloprotease toxin 5 [Uloborus diversus]